MTAHDTAVDIVLVGARGHGRHHLATIRDLAGRGLVRLAGICELTPLSDEEIPGGLGRPRQSADSSSVSGVSSQTPTSRTRP